jgi:hypothetical protein
MFWFFWALMVILPGAAQTSADRYYFSHSLAYDGYLRGVTAIYLAFFLITFSIVYRYARARGSTNAAPQIRTTIRPSIGLMTAAAFTALSFAIIARWSFSYVFLGEDADFIQVFDPLTYNLFIVVPRSLLTASIYLTVVLLGDKSFRRSGTPFFLALVLLAAQMVMYFFIANPASVTRYITFAFGISLFLLLVRRPLGKAAKALIFITMFLFLFTVFPATRVLRNGGDVRLLTSPDTYLFHGDLDGFQSMMNVVAMVHAEGMTWGKQILSAVFFWFPRTLWDAKGVGTGELGARYAGYDNMNVSSPFPIEFYSDFGIAGILISAGLLAVAFAYMDKIFCSNNGVLARRLVVAVLAGFVMIVLRGSLIGIIAPIVCTAGVVWVGIRIFSTSRSHGSPNKRRSAGFGPVLNLKRLS